MKKRYFALLLVIFWVLLLNSGQAAQASTVPTYCDGEIEMIPGSFGAEIWAEYLPMEPGDYCLAPDCPFCENKTPHICLTVFLKSSNLGLHKAERVDLSISKTPNFASDSWLEWDILPITFGFSGYKLFRVFSNFETNTVYYFRCRVQVDGIVYTSEALPFYTGTKPFESPNEPASIPAKLKTTEVITTGEPFDLKKLVTPPEAADQIVKWSFIKPANQMFGYTINNGMLHTPASINTKRLVEIQAKTAAGKTLKCKITVMRKKSVNLARDVRIQLGKQKNKATVTVSFKPSVDVDKRLKWESLTPDIVSVTGLKDGKATITALKSGYGCISATTPEGKKAMCTVEVQTKSINNLFWDGLKDSKNGFSKDFASICIDASNASGQDFTKAKKEFAALTKELGFKPTHFKKATIPLLNIVGYGPVYGMAVREEKGRATVFLVVRGSKTTGDWLANIVGALDTINSDLIREHPQFVAYAYMIHSSTKKDIDALIKKYGEENVNIVLAGHSLGGAVALKLGTYWMDKIPADNFTIYTYGAPKVFSTRMKNEYHTKGYFAHTYNLVNSGDIVPDVGYKGIIGGRAGLDITQNISGSFMNVYGSLSDYSDAFVQHDPRIYRAAFEFLN